MKHQKYLENYDTNIMKEQFEESYKILCEINEPYKR